MAMFFKRKKTPDQLVGQMPRFSLFVMTIPALVLSLIRSFTKFEKLWTAQLKVNVRGLNEAWNLP